MKLKDRQGPLAVLRGSHNDDIIALAASVMAYHTKFRNESVLKVDCWDNGSKDKTTLLIKPASLEEIEKLRL